MDCFALTPAEEIRLALLTFHQRRAFVAWLRDWADALEAGTLPIDMVLALIHRALGQVPHLN
jgi:hypothetical protein